MGINVNTSGSSNLFDAKNFLKNIGQNLDNFLNSSNDQNYWLKSSYIPEYNFLELSKKMQLSSININDIFSSNVDDLSIQFNVSWAIERKVEAVFFDQIDGNLYRDTLFIWLLKLNYLKHNNLSFFDQCNTLPILHNLKNSYINLHNFIVDLIVKTKLDNNKSKYNIEDVESCYYDDILLQLSKLTSKLNLFRNILLNFKELARNILEKINIFFNSKINDDNLEYFAIFFTLLDIYFKKQNQVNLSNLFIFLLNYGQAINDEIIYSVGINEFRYMIDYLNNKYDKNLYSKKFKTLFFDSVALKDIIYFYNDEEIVVFNNDLTFNFNTNMLLKPLCEISYLNYVNLVNCLNPIKFKKITLINLYNNLVIEIDIKLLFAMLSNIFKISFSSINDIFLQTSLISLYTNELKKLI